MKKLNKIVSVICTLAIMLSCVSVSAFASGEMNGFQPYSTNELPVEAMREMNISQLPPLPIARSFSEDGVFLSREYFVYEDGIVVEDTYIMESVTRAEKSCVATKKDRFIPTGDGNIAIEWEVKGTFYYDQAANTVVCQTVSGTITKLSSTYTIKNESRSTGYGGSNPKWASANYSFTRVNFAGGEGSHSTTVKVDSTGYAS